MMGAHADARHVDTGRDGSTRRGQGREFDRLFLEGMIKHHEGALVMVTELFATPGAGQESEIFAFASDVDADQRMEIDRMRGMLKEYSNEVRATFVLPCRCRPCGSRSGRRAARRAIRASASRPGCTTRDRRRATWNWSRACRSRRASSIREAGGRRRRRRRRRAAADHRRRAIDTSPALRSPTRPSRR